MSDREPIVEETERDDWKQDQLSCFDLIESDPDLADELALFREEGALIGVRRAGRWQYPDFQFDPETGAVRPEIAKGNLLMGASADPWGTLNWWTSPNSFIRGDLSPMQLVLADDLNEAEVELLIETQFGGY
ncbi:hypothetical protein RE9425_03360 [Prescottella equi]|nr:hypothetical protein RE9425_03360 [Prescottella equi]